MCIMYLEDRSMPLGLCVVDALCGRLLLKIITAQTITSDMMFLMAAITSAVIWPSLFQLLRQTRRSFDVH